jgi:broad specificity phosphatase PhoE
MRPSGQARCLFLLLLPLLAPWNPVQAQEETLIFLARHAERADDGAMTGEEDPHLSEAGFARAEALATALQDVGLTHIHSTHFVRTRETAAPTAEAAGIEVKLYDHRDPEGFAERLLSTPGRHLVVGHSNSLPALVGALGGDPHGAIRLLEYDRLYLVVAGKRGVRTILLRFGEPSGH